MHNQTLEINILRYKHMQYIRYVIQIVVVFADLKAF